MKNLYMLLGVFINLLLGSSFPYIVKFIAIPLSYIDFFMGYYDGSDLRGEEDLFLFFLLITLSLIIIFLSILILGNRTILRKVQMTKLGYFAFNLSIFVLGFSLVMFSFDPFNFT